MNDSSRLVVIVLLSIPLLLGPAGCSLFVPFNQSVSIRCSEPLADIYVDGDLVGKGSVRVMLRRNRHHAIVARLGDRVGTCTIDTTISTTGVLDLIGTCIFILPILGLLGPGFEKLVTDNVVITLPPETK